MTTLLTEVPEEVQTMIVALCAAIEAQPIGPAIISLLVVLAEVGEQTYPEERAEMVRNLHQLAARLEAMDASVH